MFGRLVHLLGWILSVFRSREDLVLENLALRQQLLALHAKRPRSRLGSIDKLFWVALRSLWTGWKKSLIVVQPETVVRWHRAGFRLYWTWLSRTRRVVGRKPLTKELRELIFRIVAENPTWGAVPRHNSARSQNQCLGGAPARRTLRYGSLMFVRRRRLLGWVISVF